VLRNRLTNLRWELITVYGPAHPDLAKDFITELSRKCLFATLPLVIGGDFNLITQGSDKNNGNVNQGLINKLNMFIDLHQLQEIKRSGPRYTWTNKRTNPVMVTLDRILVTNKWESKHPLCFAWSKIRVDSDYWPIFLDSGESSEKRHKLFYFEKQWLQEKDFVQMLAKKWVIIKSRFSPHGYFLHVWHGCLSLSRQFLREWNANKLNESKKQNRDILKELEDLDKLGEIQVDNIDVWAKRYKLEDSLEQIYQKEGAYWQQRGNEIWLLKGDTNTEFFHICANERRRKTKIVSLDTENGVITEQKDLKQHVVEFYKKLFGSLGQKEASLEANFWSEGEKLGLVEQVALNSTFSEKEVELAVVGMKTESAPGPNGFIVSFFTKMWGYIKGEIMKMVYDFNLNKLDLKRLNYGVITLVPKLKEANTIKQYRFICLLNVDFKIFPKMLSDRITPMADKLISES
jgi:hypothetical protein